MVKKINSNNLLRTSGGFILNKKNNLKNYGLKESTLELFKKEYSDFYIGRVILENKLNYRVITENEEVLANVSGKFSFNSDKSSDYPSVGDWVVLDRNHSSNGNAIIHSVLPRSSVLTRKACGSKFEEQIIASNVDYVFICLSMNKDFNLRRLERYLGLVWESGAVPNVVLTKSDLCENPDAFMDDLTSVCLGVDVHITSSVENSGLESIKSLINIDTSIAFIGSSGVGKSTLLNTLAGTELMDTGEIRFDDDKGKHTTTHRELLLLPSGGVIIDTPGMREVQLYSADLDHSFKDIELLSNQCKFSDCSHKNEPGCSVRAAIQSGELDAGRYKSYLKLKRELKMIENRKRRAERQINTKRNKKSSKKNTNRKVTYSNEDLAY